jgi:hypothetical protein
VLSGSLVAFMFSASQRGMQGTFAVTGTLRAESSEWLMEFELSACSRGESLMLTLRKADAYAHAKVPTRNLQSARGQL